ncbi:CdaR family transcriptional regulator [Ureibacillus sinduriensis]|uniref:Transcriptional regulator n=1 Tax=Ureibacillus sinduriensis BLB-1 = JCM 15800 TaxID=1384057 RepID=A0A0A3HRB2_9BACL|nr:sugar diacid recognition domain-containing protein [Ureibacillus sinduriensis]KGR75151.1 transcriptional regulator [Ureibacillus sinduriensis BLB-1 = JCM 15800]
MLSIGLAEEIVAQTMLRLHHNINVIGPNGVILASGDKERIDLIHEGAIEVVKTGRPLVVDEKLSNQFQNCKPGINMPIKFHDEIIGVIGITGAPNELDEIANLVQLTTEMMVHQVLTESESEWQRKNGDFIFKTLIEGESNPNILTERIHKLPFALKEPFQIILIKQEGKFATNTLSINLENILYKQPILFGQMELNEYYICLTGDSVRKMKAILDQLANLRKKFEIYMGIGPAVNSLIQLSYAYSSAKTTLAFALDERRDTFFEEIEVYTLLKNKKDPEVLKFLSKTLPGMSEKMLNTLEAFFESDLQINVCADRLQIHRHTLTYRLNKIHQFTGYQPQNFKDAFILKMAIMLIKQL